MDGFAEDCGHTASSKRVERYANPSTNRQSAILRLYDARRLMLALLGAVRDIRQVKGKQTTSQNPGTSCHATSRQPKRQPHEYLTSTLSHHARKK